MGDNLCGVCPCQFYCDHIRSEYGGLCYEEDDRDDYDDFEYEEDMDDEPWIMADEEEG